MEVFPAAIPLRGRTVVVAGEGEAAEAKARLFDGSPARLVRLVGEAAFEPTAYAGAALVFIAGDDGFAARALAAARPSGALVNLVDRPAESDFQTPAIVDRGVVVGAIATAGAAPVLATELRNRLEADWPPGLGGLAELFRRVQPEVRARLPDLAARRAALRRLVDGPAAEAALRGDVAAALALARAALDRGGAREGVVRVLAAPASTDQLTLAGLRALGRADRLVADPVACAAVLRLARRDAPRVSPEHAPAERLAAWAAAGEAVVRILAAGESGAELDAVIALGAHLERLP